MRTKPSALSTEAASAGETSIRPTLGFAGLVVLLAWAYRPLWTATAAESASFDLEYWLFIPGQFSLAPALAIALWLLWRRRRRFAEISPAFAPILTGVLAAAGIGFFLLAHSSPAKDLLFVALAFHLLAFGAAVRGTPGVRILLVPAAVFLMGLRIPAPLANEIIWNLQLWTARDVAWVANLLGPEISLAGVLLWTEKVSFQVIEGCSGFRGAQTLVLVALVVCELFAAAGARWLALVVAAPLLAYFLNVVRVWIMVSSEVSDAAEAAANGHVSQGIAMLLAGSVILYAAGWWWAPSHRARAPLDRESNRWPSTPMRPADLRVAFLMAGVLSGLALAMQIVSSGGPAAEPAIAFPEDLAGWTSERLSPDGPDVFFYGSLPWHHVIFRRYTLLGDRPRIVDVLISPDLPDEPSTGKLFTTRTPMLGADWVIKAREPIRIWTLGVDARKSLLVDGRSHRPNRLVYDWRVRDGGFWEETLRSLLATESSRLHRERPRVVVRLATPLLHDGPLALDLAKKTLDRFVTAFRGDLESL